MNNAIVLDFKILQSCLKLASRLQVFYFFSLFINNLAKQLDVYHERRLQYIYFKSLPENMKPFPGTPGNTKEQNLVLFKFVALCKNVLRFSNLQP